MTEARRIQDTPVQTRERQADVADDAAFQAALAKAVVEHEAVLEKLKES